MVNWKFWESERDTYVSLILNFKNIAFGSRKDESDFNFRLKNPYRIICKNGGDHGFCKGKLEKEKDVSGNPNRSNHPAEIRGSDGKEFRRQQFLSSVVPCGSGKRSSRKTDGQIKFFSRREVYPRDLPRFASSERYPRRSYYKNPRPIKSSLSLSEAQPSIEMISRVHLCDSARRNLSWETLKSRYNFMETPESS